MAKIFCENCGAAFDAGEPKCPHCGFISYPGAEEKYMKDLETVEDNLEDVVIDQKKAYKRELSKQVKKTILLFIIAAVIVLTIIGIIAGISKLVDYSYRSDYDAKKELLWEKENFPKLDKLFEEGNYEAIIEFQNALYEDRDNTHSLYEWQYSWFVNVCRSYALIQSYMQDLDNGETLRKKSGGTLVREVMWLYSEEYKKENYKQVYTEKELAIAEGYSSEMKALLIQRLKFTEEEIDELYEKCMKDGYFNSTVCYDYGEQIYERFR